MREKDEQRHAQTIVRHHRRTNVGAFGEAIPDTDDVYAVAGSRPYEVSLPARYERRGVADVALCVPKANVPHARRRAIGYEHN